VTHESQVCGLPPFKSSVTPQEPPTGHSIEILRQETEDYLARVRERACEDISHIYEYLDRLTEEVGFRIDLQRNLIGSAGVLQIILEIGNLIRHPSAGVETPVGRKLVLTRAAVNFKHFTAGVFTNGWKLRIFKNGATTEGTQSGQLVGLDVSNAAFGDNITTGDLVPNVTMVPGERWWADLFMFSDDIQAVDNPVVAVVLYGKFTP